MTDADVLNLAPNAQTLMKVLSHLICPGVSGRDPGEAVSFENEFDRGGA